MAFYRHHVAIVLEHSIFRSRMFDLALRGEKAWTLHAAALPVGAANGLGG